MSRTNRTKCGILQIGSKKISTYEGINTVGRNKEAVVILKDLVASQHHAIITIINDCHYVSDLKSTNGTKLNNVKLVPFKMYQVEDGHILEFTPAYIGHYKKLSTNVLQSMTLANESQMTPVEDGFFTANTQLQNTQFQNNETQVNETQNEQTEQTECVIEKIVYIHDQETQFDPIRKVDFEEIQPMNITVPTINEVSTQIVVYEPVLAAFTDSQAFNTQESPEKESESLIKQDNPNLNLCNVHPSSGETSTALNSSNATAAITSCSLSSEGIIQEEIAENLKSMCGNNVEKAVENEDILSEGSKTDLEGSDTDIDDQSLMEVADNVMNTSMTCLEAQKANSTQPENTRNVKVAIADLSTESVLVDTQLTQERMIALSAVSSLNLQYTESQDNNSDNDSVDMLGNVSLKETNEMQYIPVQDNTENQEKPSTSKVDEEKLLMGKASVDIISDSDESEEFLLKQSIKTPVRNNSTLHKSRFILSDSEDEHDEKSEDKSVNKSRKQVNDTLSDYDDSFVQRKSLGDTSYIPATQDASFSRIVNESYKLGLSHIQEISELGDISAFKSSANSTKIDSSVHGEQQDNAEAVADNEDIHDDCTDENKINDTMMVDFIAPTQKLNVFTKPDAGSVENKLEDDDYLAPTQVLSKPSISLQLESQDMFDFNVATQKITDEVDFDAATQAVASFKRSENVDNEDADFLAPTQQISKAVEGADSELFCAPTQSVSGFLKSKRELRKSCRLSKLVDFDAPTQKVFIDNEKEKTENEDVFAADTQALDTSLENDEDCFYASTQPINDVKISKEKKRVTFNTINTESNLSIMPEIEKSIDESSKHQECKLAVELFLSEEQNDIDFDAPTQTVVKYSEQPTVVESLDDNDEDDFDAPTQHIMRTVGIDDRHKPAYTEAETQEICSIIPPPVTKVPEVESQLEVMFQSQNVSLSVVDTSRPLNPLANILEASTTQDVIDSLSGSKRLSDEFGEDRNVKRAKTTPVSKGNSTPNVRSKSIRKSKSDTSKVTPQTRRRTTSKAATCEVNNNPSTSKNKSILDFMRKSVSQSVTELDSIKPSSKLSLKKKAVAENVLETFLSNDDSNDEVECLVDTIPIKSKFLDVPKDVEVVDDKGNNVSISSEVNATLDLTEVRKNKRRLMDEETMSSMPSPVVKLVRLSSNDISGSAIEDTDKPAKTKNTIEKSPKDSTKSKNDRKSKTEKNVTKRRTRQTRNTTSNAQSSESEEEKTEVKKKGTRKLVRPPGRSSTRLKKIVDYNEKEGHPAKASTSRKVIETAAESSDDNLVVIDVPNNQVVLTSTDEIGLQKAQAKLNVEDAKPALRGRLRKAKMIKEEKAFVASTPDRSKRLTKPKVLFTMLDDPKLKQIIRGLGGTIVEQLHTSTVLVTTKVQRTLKLLSAIANSIPICSPNWLHECKKANAFLDPWEHLIRDQEAEKQWKFSIGDTLEKSKRGKIFEGYQFILLITLSADVIKGAIEANGGKVVTRKPSTGNFIVVAAPSKKDKYQMFLKSNVNVVSSEFVLVGILRQELCFDEFKLT